MSGCLKTSPRRPRTSWDLRYLQEGGEGGEDQGQHRDHVAPAALVHPHRGVQLVNLTSANQLILPSYNQQLV